MSDEPLTALDVVKAIADALNTLAARGCEDLPVVRVTLNEALGEAGVPWRVAFDGDEYAVKARRRVRRSTLDTGQFTDGEK